MRSDGREAGEPGGTAWGWLLAMLERRGPDDDRSRSQRATGTSRAPQRHQ